MGCHSLLQGIILTWGLTPGLMLCRQILYHLSHQGNLKDGSVYNLLRFCERGRWNPQGQAWHLVLALPLFALRHQNSFLWHLLCIQSAHGSNAYPLFLPWMVVNHGRAYGVLEKGLLLVQAYHGVGFGSTSIFRAVTRTELSY